MIKKLLLLGTVMVLFYTTGCGKVVEGVNQVVAGAKEEMGAVLEETKITDEELYGELDRLLRNPDNADMTKLVDEFTFTTIITSEPEEITFDDDEQVYQYQTGIISRNLNDIFLLEVSELEEAIPVDTIVSVTGTIGGVVYDIQDNKKISVLEILAKNVKIVPESEIDTNTEGEVVLDSGYGPGVYQFQGAHYTTDSFNDVIVLYLDYTNTGSNDVAPSLSGNFRFVQGDQILGVTMFSLDEVDPAALDAGSGIAEKTFAGKTFRYYYPLTANPEAMGEPIYIVRIDDHFNMIDDIMIPVEASLEAIQQ